MCVEGDSNLRQEKMYRLDKAKLQSSMVELRRAAFNPAWTRSFKHFDRVILVGVNTQIARDCQRFLDDISGTEIGVLQ